jgi:hypothetical protein
MFEHRPPGMAVDNLKTRGKIRQYKCSGSSDTRMRGWRASGIMLAYEPVDVMVVSIAATDEQN